MKDSVDAQIKNYMQNLLTDDKMRKIQQFKVLNYLAEKKQIVFAGDSITEGFPIGELYAKRIYNRGIGGLTSQELLENIDTLVLDLQPRKVFLLIGTNDLGCKSDTQLIAHRVIEIVDKVRSSLPNTTVYVQSVYPVYKELSELSVERVDVRTNDNINAINRLVSEGCKNKATYIDTASVLQDVSGNLKEELTYDGLHLTAEGYLVVSDYLANFIE